MQPTARDTDIASLPHRRKLTGPPATRPTGREPLITFLTSGEPTTRAAIRHHSPQHREEPARSRLCLTNWLDISHSGHAEVTVMRDPHP